MPDILRDHVAMEEFCAPKPEHICSTLTARVLKAALGLEKYTEAASIGERNLGYRYAHPNLVFEMTKAAKTFEENDKKHTYIKKKEW